MASEPTLNPGDYVTPVPQESDPYGSFGTLYSTNVSFGPTLDGLAGNLISSVITNDASNPWYFSGGLTFTYQILLSPSATNGASEISIGSFAGFLADVNYNTNMGGMGPFAVQRSGSGQDIRFSFVPELGPSSSSALLVVQTDGTMWRNDIASVLDNSAAANIPTLVPVPEPASVGLFLLGSAIAARYRRSALAAFFRRIRPKKT
ncbi:MAG: PEP-CTERM sorting domain-containing protein [Verrucomicrobia bacterium]|nr:PEP-CTERM sorting domain-containing protein [Verrucomicrobiota bacterium]MDE3099841.1 PEP-CTERM sorting domain-containing protein [Verrucomicrobiota bacterium]